MGKYINIGNAEFESVRKDEYVDKSMLIAYVNKVLRDTCQTFRQVYRCQNAECLLRRECEFPCALPRPEHRQRPILRAASEQIPGDIPGCEWVHFGTDIGSAASGA